MGGCHGCERVGGCGIDSCRYDRYDITRRAMIEATVGLESWKTRATAMIPTIS